MWETLASAFLKHRKSTRCGRLDSAETMDVRWIFRRMAPSVPRACRSVIGRRERHSSWWWTHWCSARAHRVGL